MRTKQTSKKYSESILVLPLLLLLIFFVQCNNPNKKTIEEYVESNIDYCMSPLIDKGVDSLQARSICKCCLEEMFKIEPNLLKLNNEEWNQLFESHKEKIIDNCPELKECVKSE